MKGHDIHLLPSEGELYLSSIPTMSTEALASMSESSSSIQQQILTPLPRGRQLERDFGVYMEKTLGCTGIEYNQPAKGKVAERAYEIDVRGNKRFPIPYWIGSTVGLIALGMPVWLIIISLFITPLRDRGDKDWWVIPAWIATMVVGANLMKRGDRNIWVECKDLRTTVRREQVQKLIMSVKDVRDLDRARWKPDDVWLVSSSGFDPDALHFAREHKIRCFRKDRDGFTEV